MSVFVDTGSNKLEIKHANITVSTLHILQSSSIVIPLLKGTIWVVGRIHCSCIKAVLPTSFPSSYNLGNLYVFLDWVIGADWLEMPGSLILLLIVAPGLFAHAFRGSWVGVAICLLIGCYLLQEHIRASGGFRNSFMQSHGISNTIVMLETSNSEINRLSHANSKQTRRIDR
uniref:Uncharacterized protein n=1 Tax=Lactuca sativa TaxID=4236 RepID=A0A9R1W0S2_LACSA|nr:hypothetical protein LSAT_V11C400224680 [Lactuca sativa]